MAGLSGKSGKRTLSSWHAFEASVNVDHSGSQVCEDDFFQSQTLGEGSTGLV